MHNLKLNQHGVTEKDAIEALKTIIRYIGDNPEREGLLETPKRVLKAYHEYFSGYHEDSAQVLAKTFSGLASYDEMVIVKDIDVYSHCEHHMVPFYGSAHVAYIPNDKVVGLSKLSRVVQVYAKRLQTQEMLTMQVATAIEKALNPKGVAVIISAKHGCMNSRGVGNPDAATVTSYYTGILKTDAEKRKELYTLITG